MDNPSHIALEIEHYQERIGDLESEIARLRERVAELEPREALLQLQIEAMQECIASDDPSQSACTFEERAEELIVTEVNHEKLMKRESLLLAALRWAMKHTTLHAAGNGDWMDLESGKLVESPPQDTSPLIAEAVKP